MSVNNVMYSHLQLSSIIQCLWEAEIPTGIQTMAVLGCRYSKPHAVWEPPLVINTFMLLSRIKGFCIARVIDCLLPIPCRRLSDAYASSFASSRFFKPAGLASIHRYDLGCHIEMGELGSRSYNQGWDVFQLIERSSDIHPLGRRFWHPQQEHRRA